MPSLQEGDLQVLNEEPESSARSRYCVMCPVRRGSPKLLPCCLCENWYHISRSYQTHLGKICPCHVRILDPRRKIIVMSHPYLENCVVLPTRSTIRTDSRNMESDIGFRITREDTSASRWSASTWINVLLEKHAWISASLFWMPGASDTAAKGAYEDSRPDALECRPISLSYGRMAHMC